MRSFTRISLVSLIAPWLAGTYAQLLDTCANVNAPLVVDLPFPLSDLNVPIQACLCVSALSEYINANVQLSLAAGILGLQAVIDLLTPLIGASNPQTCTLPEHATAACEASNPCAFTCTDGYTPSPPTNPTTCVCVGTVQPDDTCLPDPCPSGICARSLLKRAFCKRGHTACGSFGRGKRSFDCVDTMNDLESCGGCMVPFDGRPANGVDCSALPGVADVMCRKGTCVVSRCLKGFNTTEDLSACYRAL